MQCWYCVHYNLELFSCQRKKRPHPQDTGAFTDPLSGVDVDHLRPHLGVDDGLAAVQSAIAGEEIADGAGHAEKQQVSGAEQLHTQHHRGQRAIHRAAEYANEADAGSKACVQSQQRARHTAEGRADEERRHHLAALETAADGHSGEEDLPHPGHGLRLTGERLLNDIHTGTVVVGAQPGLSTDSAVLYFAHPFVFIHCL